MMLLPPLLPLVALPPAYVPFVDSLQAVFPGLDEYTLWFSLPLIVLISLVYKTTRTPQLADVPWATAKLSLQIVVIMALAAVGVFAVHFWAIRWL